MLKLQIGAIALFFACTNLFCQSYEVAQVGDVYSQEEIENALNSADLCGMYYYNDSRTLTFSDSSIVILKPISELEDVNENCAVEFHPVHEEELWEVKGDFLIRRHKKHSKQ